MPRLRISKQSGAQASSLEQRQLPLSLRSKWILIFKPKKDVSFKGLTPMLARPHTLLQRLNSLTTTMLSAKQELFPRFNG